jgi:hypothetical protein
MLLSFVTAFIFNRVTEAEQGQYSLLTFHESKLMVSPIRRKVFTSVADLARKLCKYIEAYAKSANLFAGLIPILRGEFVLPKSPGRLTSFTIGSGYSTSG